jgi:hypothetical protein
VSLRSTAFTLIVVNLHAITWVITPHRPYLARTPERLQNPAVQPRVVGLKVAERGEFVGSSCSVSRRLTFNLSDPQLRVPQILNCSGTSWQQRPVKTVHEALQLSGGWLSGRAAGLIMGWTELLTNMQGLRESERSVLQGPARAAGCSGRPTSLPAQVVQRYALPISFYFGASRCSIHPHNVMQRVV